ncbi:MAG: hypothetical protein ABJE95_36495 [Byssovorax sp.]
MSARARGPRGRLAHAAATIAALLLVGATLGAPSRALAEPTVGAAPHDPRPWDALWIDAEPLVVPPLPPEYLKQEEGGIRLAYQPSTRDRVRALLALATTIRAELGAALGTPVLGSIEIRVAAAPSEMARLAPVEQLPSYATAVTFSQSHLVVMSALSPLSLDAPNLEGWLRHALAHLALDEAASTPLVPRWFHEGFAVDFAGDDSTARAETLARAALSKRLLGLAQIEAQLPEGVPEGTLSCAEAADFVRFLGPQRLAELTSRLRGGAPWKDALDASAGADPGLELAWRKAMARRYSFFPVLFGSLLLWMVVAGVVLVRRARARRRRDDVATRRETSERRARIARAAARRAPQGPRGDRVLDDEALHEATPPDPEVPRVEHDGRWYTLH